MYRFLFVPQSPFGEWSTLSVTADNDFNNQNREDPAGRASQDANRVAPTQRKEERTLFWNCDPPQYSESCRTGPTACLLFSMKGCEDNGYRRTIVRGNINEALWRT
ncbi:MAG: hypothetical protein ACON5J_19640 [Rubripirellula sp.]